jgi:NifU-like protein involved in Fe-S cluster formation
MLAIVYVVMAGPDHKARRLAASRPVAWASAASFGGKPLAIRAGPPYIAGIMLSDVYNRRILELAAHIPRIGRLGNPDATAVAHSRLCGSRVTVDLAMQGDVVSDFAHDVKACALGQASSSIMAQHVVGSSAAELRALRETARRMLKEGGDPPDGKWADVAVLLPVRDYKARHASTLLIFDAVVDAITQIEARRAANPAPKPV